MNSFLFLGDDFLTLPSMIFSGIYFIVMACGIVHFGVFTFYKYKEINQSNTVKL